MNDRKPLTTDLGEIVIAVDDLTGSEIAGFLQEHIDEMQSISAPESKHALDLDGLRQDEITFWTAKIAGKVVGCGALKDLGDGVGEIKSMRTARSLKKRGIASTLLTHVLVHAERLGYELIFLETGSQEFFEPACKLYLKHGFTYCGPFAEYEDDPNSVYMTRRLGEQR